MATRHVLLQEEEEEEEAKTRPFVRSLARFMVDRFSLFCHAVE